MPGKAWIGGSVVDAEEARVPVFDRGFLYGDSVYEVTRTFGGKPFALGEHLDRMEESARRIAMALPPRGEIDRAVEEAIAAARSGPPGGGPPECYLRIVVTRGSGPIGLDPALADAPRLVVLALPLKLPEEEVYREGAMLAVVGARRNAPGAIDPAVKSGNYLDSVMAVAEARVKGAYEALMCDPVGRLAEGASSNLFLVRAAGGRLATPPLSVGLLEGITRRHVIALARRMGLSVDEVSLWPVDLARAEEAFITSSVRGIVPVVRVHLGGEAKEPAIIGAGTPGPVTRRLSEVYLREAMG
jgi:branched-chain amino acid aminotransferase